MKVSNTVSDENIMENNYMFVILWNLSFCSHLIFPQGFFSSPEHKVLWVSYCDSAVSVVCRAASTFCLVYTLEATFLVRLSWNLVKMFVLMKS